MQAASQQQQQGAVGVRAGLLQPHLQAVREFVAEGAQDLTCKSMQQLGVLAGRLAAWQAGKQAGNEAACQQQLASWLRGSRAVAVPPAGSRPCVAQGAQEVSGQR